MWNFIIFTFCLSSSLFEFVWSRHVPPDVKPHIPVDNMKPGRIRISRSAVNNEELGIAAPEPKVFKFQDIWTHLQRDGPPLEIKKTEFKNRKKRSPNISLFCSFRLCPLAINSPGGNRAPILQRQQRPPAVAMNDV